MKRLMIMIVLTMMGTVCYPTLYTNNYLGHIFFDRLPGARAESMGKILSVDRGEYLLSQSNPALLADSQGISLSYANSAPYYNYDRDQFESHFAELIYDTEKYGILSLNIHHLSLDETQMYDPPMALVDDQNLITATYAKRFGHTLRAGLNINYYFCNYRNYDMFRRNDQTYEYTEERETNLFFDLGLSGKYHTFNSEHIESDIIIGAYLKNIFGNDITKLGLSPRDASILRVGASHRMLYSHPQFAISDHLIGLELAAEYQNLPGYDYRTGWKFGTEISMLDILFLRAGYYKESLDSMPHSKEHVSSTTYGAGIKIDLRRFNNDFLPLTISLDYSSLPQPEFKAEAESEWDNFKNLSVNVRYLSF
jgi:hypothetical protein